MTVFSLSGLQEYFARDGYSDYVIDGVLPIGVTVAYGPTGTGKTGFAVATAMAVANGSVWAGRHVSRGAVVYAATEDIDGVMKRLFGAATDGGTHSLPVYGTDEATRLADPEKGIVTLERCIDDFGVASHLKLIVVDTLAVSFGPFSQDDSNHAASFMANMATLSKRYGCAVLVIHHTGKDRSGKDRSDMRGSQVFKDAADALLKLAPGSKGGDPTVTVEKQKNGPKEGVFSFTIGSTFIERGTEEVRRISVQAIANLRSVGSDAAQALEEPARQTYADEVLRVLETMMGAGVTEVAIKEWQDACYSFWSGVEFGTKKTRFSRALNGLEKNKKIAITGDFVTAIVTRNNNAGNGTFVTPTVTPSPLKGEGTGNVGVDNELEDALGEVSEPVVRKRRAG